MSFSSLRSKYVRQKHTELQKILRLVENKVKNTYLFLCVCSHTIYVLTFKSTHFMHFLTRLRSINIAAFDKISSLFLQVRFLAFFVPKTAFVDKKFYC